MLTGLNNLEELSNVKNFPIYIGATDKDISTDLFQDLRFDICKDTGLIQLRYLIDPYLLYSQFHSEAIGGIWEDHHNKFAELIQKYSKSEKILEIGGSDSRLATKVLKQNPNIQKWVVVEPSFKKKVDNPKIDYIDRFFDKNFKVNEKFNMIVSSQVIEHAYDTNEFLENVRSLLNNGEYHIFACPYFDKYLINRYANAINFEHTLFLTEEIFDYLISKNNFKIVEKVYYLNHTIFYVTKKEKTETINLPNKYKANKKMYIEFIDYFKNFVKDLNDELEKTTKDVYMFGAHIFSQYLIMLGLNTTKIKYILDNSQLKHNKRLYGTDMIIKKPEDVNLENALVILKVGEYRNEISSQLLNINSNIEFYE